MQIRKDLSGQRFGNLIAIKPIGKNEKNGQTLWLCKCDCGNDHITTTTYLVTGDCKSCGCLNSKRFRKMITKHGMANTRIYNIWQNIKRRCRNKNHPRYKDYGKRGIDICNEWEDFNEFYQWAITNGYQDNLTIERIDNDKGYSPDNCRWITMNEQQFNKRTTHYLTYKGVTKTLTEWAKIKNMRVQTLASRINRFHWSVEKALETPIKSVGG